MKIHSYQEALEYLERHMPQALATQFPGEIGFDRTKYIMEQLGNPQDTIPVIHVAGTSGKGSICTLASHILVSQGLRVGMTLSPHILDVRERVQINNSLISKEDFCKYLNMVVPVIDAVPVEKYGMPTFFETIIALAWMAFVDMKMDYVVLETGLGGLLDGTNTVKNPSKVALLSHIGYDHVHILGETLPEIAYQKAHIMQKGNRAFAINQDDQVKQVFSTIAEEKGANLSFIKEGTDYILVKEDEHENIFHFSFDEVRWENIRLGLHGAYQVQNTALALAAFVYIAKRDGLSIKEDKLRSALEKISFSGRFHIIENGTSHIVLDGAHNVQKMEAFLSSLKHMYPTSSSTFLVAFKKGKDTRGMLKQIITLADSIIVTGFINTTNDMVHSSEDPQDLGVIIKELGFTNVTVIPDVKQALDSLLQSKTDIQVVTGSLYFLGDVYPLLQD